MYSNTNTPKKMMAFFMIYSISDFSFLLLQNQAFDVLAVVHVQIVYDGYLLFVSVKQNRFLGFLLGVFDVFHHGIGNGEAAVAHGQAGQGIGLYHSYKPRTL